MLEPSDNHIIMASDEANTLAPPTMTKAYLLGVPPEIHRLFLDLLHKKDLNSLSRTCRELHGIAAPHLHKRMVIRPARVITELSNIRERTAEWVKSIEFFPAESGETNLPRYDSPYEPGGDLGISKFPNLRAVHLHGHDHRMRRATMVLLKGHKSITDLTLTFKQEYFLPAQCGEELRGLGSLEGLSVRLVNVGRDWPGVRSRKPWAPEDVVPIWDMITANAGTLRALDLDFPFELDRWETLHTVNNQAPTTNNLFPTNTGLWERPLQLRDLKLQHLQNFGEVYAETKFFNPKALQSLSLVNCPGSDDALLELASSLTNLKSLQIRNSVRDPLTIATLLQRLPALETLHIALRRDSDFDYQWLAPQKHSIKHLWIEVPDSKDQNNDDFEDWTNLQELAFTRFHAHNGRRAGVMCMKNLKIPADLRILRLLHPPGHGRASNNLNSEQVTKMIESLAIRQFRMISTKYPKTYAGKRQRLYVKPRLEILAIGARINAAHRYDRPRVLRLKFEHTERLGKFKGLFERTHINTFAREYPKTTMLAYGELRGSRAWLGKHLTDEMQFFDEIQEEAVTLDQPDQPNGN
ncbi:hypothetical protein TWF281_010317 [Arthrobotrys megalospora]